MPPVFSFTCSCFFLRALESLFCLQTPRKTANLNQYAFLVDTSRLAPPRSSSLAPVAAVACRTSGFFFFPQNTIRLEEPWGHLFNLSVQSYGPAIQPPIKSARGPWAREWCYNLKPLPARPVPAEHPINLGGVPSHSSGTKSLAGDPTPPACRWAWLRAVEQGGVESVRRKDREGLVQERARDRGMV